MLVNFISLNPKNLNNFLDYNIINKAIQLKFLKIQIIDINKISKVAASSIYGGGFGQLIKIPNIISAIKFCANQKKTKVKKKKLYCWIQPPKSLPKRML